MTDPKELARAAQEMKKAAEETARAQRAAKNAEKSAQTASEQQTQEATQGARKNIKDNVGKSAIADRFAKQADKMPADMVRVVSNVIDVEPKDLHKEINAGGEGLAQDIKAYISVHSGDETKVSQGIRTLTQVADMYAQNPDAARKILRILGELEQAQVVSREQITRIVPGAVQELATDVGHGHAKKENAQYVVQVLNEQYGNKAIDGSPRIDGPDLKAAFEQQLAMEAMIAFKAKEDKETKEERATHQAEEVKEAEQKTEKEEVRIGESEAPTKIANEVSTNTPVFTEIPENAVVEAKAEVNDKSKIKVQKVSVEDTAVQIKPELKPKATLEENLAKLQELGVDAKLVKTYQDAVQQVVKNDTPEASANLRKANQELRKALPSSGEANRTFNIVRQQALVAVYNSKSETQRKFNAGEYGLGISGASGKLEWPDENDIPEKKRGKYKQIREDFDALFEAWKDSPRDIDRLMNMIDKGDIPGLKTEHKLKLMKQLSEARDQARQADEQRVNQMYGQGERRTRPDEVKEAIIEEATKDVINQYNQAGTEIDKTLETPVEIIKDAELKRLLELAQQTSTTVELDKINKDIFQRHKNLKISGQTNELQEVGIKEALKMLGKKARLLRNGVPTTDSQFGAVEVNLKELLTPTVPISEGSPLRKIINSGRSAATRGTLKAAIRNLEKEIAKGLPPVDSFAAKEILKHLQLRERNFEFAVEPIMNARMESMQNRQQLAAMRAERLASGEFVIKDEVVLEGLGNAISSFSENELGEIIDRLEKRLMVGVSIDLKPRLENAINIIKREKALVRMTGAADRLTDTHLLQAGLEMSDMKALHRFQDIESMLELFVGKSSAEINGLFDSYWDDAVKALNKLLKQGTINANGFFQENFNVLVEEPLYKQMITMVAKGRDEYQRLLSRGEIQSVKVDCEGIKVDNGKPTYRKLSDVDLGEAFEHLLKKMQANREVTEFTQNFNVIIRTRGTAEDLAGYAKKLRTAPIEYAILGEKERLTQETMRYYEHDLLKILGDKNWILPQTLAELEVSVKKHLETLNTSKGKLAVGDDELKRAMVIGRGMGMTTMLLRWMAMADAPRGYTFYSGYEGDALLGNIDVMRHHWFRWKSQGGKNAQGETEVTDRWVRLMYTMLTPAHKGKGWNPDSLIRNVAEYGGDVRTSLNIYEGDMNLPYIQEPNFFGIGSWFSRAGWRFNGALKHELSAIRDVVDGALLPERPLFEGDDHLLWNNLNLDQTWQNMKRAGSGACYYFADQIANAKEKLKGRSITIGNKTIQIDTDVGKNLKRVVMEQINGRNPLFFVRIDPTQPESIEREAANSIRMQALRNIGELGLTDRVHQWENDCILISEQLTQKKLWDLKDLSNEQIKEVIEKTRGNRQSVSVNDAGQEIFPDWYKEATRYWKEIQTIVQTGESPRGQTWLDHFSQVKLGWGVGSWDADLSEFSLSEGNGESLIARALGDEHVLIKGCVEPYKNEFFKILTAVAGASKDKPSEEVFHPLMEYYKKAEEAQDAVNGATMAHKVVFKLAYQVDRFNDKRWSAQLPLGIGRIQTQLAKLLGPEWGISMSQQVLGGDIEPWDESMTRAHNNLLATSGLLPFKAKEKGVAETHEWYVQKLNDMTGARLYQAAVFDTVRQTTPYAILFSLIGLWSFLQKDFNES